jgi:Mn2+/Fe2+ NRAMP family transporter
MLAGSRVLRPVGRRVAPYSMASVRAKIAYVLLAIFGATVAGSFLALGADWATAGAIKDFVEPVLTAEVGLLGAGLRFPNVEKLPPDRTALYELARLDRRDGVLLRHP